MSAAIEIAEQLARLASEIRSTAVQTAEACESGDSVPDLVEMMLGWADEIEEIVGPVTPAPKDR